MLIPNNHPNSDGDIVFEMTHISEKHKGPIYDKNYKNWITVDPITNKIIKTECECYDFVYAKAGSEPCKHLREDIALLSNYGIQYGEPEI